SAEISHELRTPLARISAEAELALGQERTTVEYRAALESVRANAEQLAGAVETLVAAARAESAPRGTADAGAAIARAADAGAGLGLALARRLAQAAGGDIAAEPGAGGGRFRVTLPGG